MKGGCNANQLSVSEKITSNPEILPTFFGLPLDFSEKTYYKTSVILSKFCLNEEMFLSIEIENLLRNGVITECRQEYISKICFPNFLSLQIWWFI